MTPEELKICENVVCAYTNNNFIQRFSVLETGSVGGLLLDENRFYNEGDRIIIVESYDGKARDYNGLNNGRYNIEIISDGVMKLDKQLYACSYNRVYKVVYPDDVLFGFGRMIDWWKKSKQHDGIASETISRHSISYESRTKDNTYLGFPFELLGFCEPYMKAKFN